MTPRNSRVINNRTCLVQIRTSIIISSIASHQICHSPQVTAKITKTKEMKSLKTEFRIILTPQEFH